MSKEFALYKGESLLAIGTIKEIADAMKVKKETIEFYSMPAYLKRAEKRKEGLDGNFRVLVSLDA